MQIYFTQEDIKIRIEELRRSKQAILDFYGIQEQELVWQFQSLQGRPDFVVDIKGRVLGAKDKKPVTPYLEQKVIQEDVLIKQKRLYTSFGVKIAGK